MLLALLPSGLLIIRPVQLGAEIASPSMIGILNDFHFSDCLRTLLSSTTGSAIARI